MKQFKKYFDNDHYQGGLRVVVICTLAVILTVGVNLLSGLLPTKLGNVDVSTEKIHSIAGETQEKAAGISDPVTIYYVCEEGEEYRNTEVMLNLYADASGNISVVKVDPAYDPGLITRYVGETSLTNNSVIVVSGDRRQVIRYSDYYTSGVFVLEDYMNSAIDYVTSHESKTAYALTGHGEREIHSSTAAYMGLDGFALKEMDLMKDRKIPADANLVILNGIRQDITADEAELLLNYLSEGGGLLLATDYTTDTWINLARVTDYFGAAMGEGLVMESDSARYTDENPAWLYPTIYSGDYTLTKGISYMLLPNAKPIEVKEELDEEIEFTNLLEASDSAYALSTNRFTNETGSQEGPFTVGASFERAEGEKGKMIWVTSGYLSDVSVSQAVGGGNITFFLNSICWLGEEEPAASIHGKKISTQYLTFTDGELGLFRIILIGVVPAVVLAVGVAVRVRRKRR